MVMIVNSDHTSFEKHRMFTATDHVKEISREFLSKNNLNHFSYVRKYVNGAGYALSTHPEMTMDFYKLKFYNVRTLMKGAQELAQSVLLLNYVHEDDQSLVKHAQKTYGVDHGLAIIKNHGSYSEHYYFAAKPENYLVVNKYIARLDEYYNFCFYFREKARKIITALEHEKVIPIDMENENGQTSDTKFYQEYNHRYSVNIEEPLFNKLFYTKECDKFISRREFQCLAGLASGKTAREISKHLTLSERTVNFYIDKVKQKTSCLKRPELIRFYHDLF